MNLLTLFLTAFGLSMDAFAVSISNTMCFTGISKKQTLTSSLCFGIFQGAMPILGFLAGQLFANYITALDHWIALALLGFIGGKMVLEGLKALQSPDSCPARPPYNTKTMLLQGIATSIDALAVGISFAMLETNILLAAILIASITFVMCLIGSALGKKFGALLGDWAQILGGLILVGIGAKIFIEHMFTG